MCLFRKYVIAYNHFTKKMTITYVGSKFDKMLYGDDMGVAFTVYDLENESQINDHIKNAKKMNYTIHNDMRKEFHYWPYEDIIII